ncbi:MAG: preprotein translocase subunit SecE [Planctomycetes bacterium]|jgi:preprotein translocase subunit SecE|nr:preprotein translocase subunit SecE [Planctomycetota bacterium]
MNLKIYKRGQGKNTRLGTGLACFAIAAYGCVVLHRNLQAVTENVWIETLVPAGVCVVFAALIWWLSNHPTVADFLIAAESEIKKVSWSTRKEIVNSTIVVIVVVAVMSAGIGLWDILLGFFFSSIIGLY